MSDLQLLIQALINWLRLALDVASALIIALGFLLALVQLVKLFKRNHKAVDFSSVRLTLASYLALGLEFQLGSDVLSTTISPTWDTIGKLAAIAVIRTLLNYFLTREVMLEEKSLVARTLTNDARVKRAAQEQERADLPPFP